MRLPKRSLVAAIHDVIMAAVSLPVAYYLRLGESALFMPQAAFAENFVVFMLCFTVALFGFSLQKEVWRYVSINELKTIAKVITVSIVVTYAALFLLQRLQGVPRSVPVLQWMVLGALLSISRVCYRLLREGNGITTRRTIEGTTPMIPVVVMGANDHAEGFIRAMQRGSQSPYHVVAVLDKKYLRDGRSMRGIPIFSADSPEKVNEALLRLEEQGKKPQRMILTDDYMDEATASAMLAICDALGIGLARLPRVTDFHQGVESEIKPIAIEDLLGRAQSHHDALTMRKLIAGNVVMVTGAGGSIGSELVRQIAQHQPKHLLLVEQNEFNLYQIDKELATHAPEILRTPLIADVRDTEQMRQIFMEYPPELLFHAAALKHVPLAEQNPEQTILTNVFGTQNIARLGVQYGVKAMVLVSTDKAVNPANVMGATKRLAEYVWLEETAHAKDLKAVIVRFGNVLGSTGSVVPLFQEQLRAGGPITVTHPDMQRYFMTIREASGLVIQAAAQAKEAASMFILNMGKPVRIVELAEQMIRLAGYTPYKDIGIVFTGLRPGEKLTEELVYENETLQETGHAKIRQSCNLMHRKLDKLTMDTLKQACITRNALQARRSLRALVSEYISEDEQAATELKEAL